MPESANTLRALIRLIHPTHTLKSDLETSIHAEEFEGIGEIALRNFTQLQSAAASLLADDPYVTGLGGALPENSSDKEKVWHSYLAVGQLAAYLESHVGVSASAGGSGKEAIYNIQKGLTVGSLHAQNPEELLRQLQEESAQNASSD